MNHQDIINGAEIDADDSWGNWVWVVGDIGIEDPTEDDIAAWCALAAAWLTENEGPDRSISVRRPFGSEASGIYYRRENGDLQLSGYSITTPDAIKKLVNCAWQYACENLAKTGTGTA